MSVVSHTNIGQTRHTHTQHGQIDRVEIVEETFFLPEANWNNCNTTALSSTTESLANLTWGFVKGRVYWIESVNSGAQVVAVVTTDYYVRKSNDVIVIRKGGPEQCDVDWKQSRPTWLGTHNTDDDHSHTIRSITRRLLCVGLVVVCHACNRVPVSSIFMVGVFVVACILSKPKVFYYG